MWLFLALCTAFFQAVKDVFIKSAAGTPGVVLCWGYCGVSALLLAPLAIWSYDGLQPGFWTAAAMSSTLNTMAFWFYFRALECGDLSATTPMLTFTPAFMLFTSPLILGESAQPMGALGILLIVFGSYVLNLHERTQGGFWGPFKAVIRDKGPRYMLITSLIWSFSANIDRLGVAASGPFIWVPTLFTCIFIVLTPLAVRAAKGNPFTGKLGLRPKLKQISCMSVAESISLTCQMIAITMMIVPYVVAVKRLSAVFGILLAGMFLGETNIRQRALGASLMVAGVVVIAALG